MAGKLKEKETKSEEIEKEIISLKKEPQKVSTGHLDYQKTFGKICKVLDEIINNQKIKFG